MSPSERLIHNQARPRRSRVFLGWFIVAVFAVATELLTDVLKDFARALRGPDFHWEPAAVFWFVLFNVIVIVPIVLMSRSSDNIVDRRTEKIVFVVSLLVAAYFLPPAANLVRLLPK
jgi:hypothetical protein